MINLSTIVICAKFTSVYWANWLLTELIGVLSEKRIKLSYVINFL